jgi:hypothetical protein
MHAQQTDVKCIWSYIPKRKAVPLPPCRRQGERLYSSYSFLTSILYGMSGQRHALIARSPWGKDPGTHCIGGWVGLRAGLNTEARGKNLCLCRRSNAVARHSTHTISQRLVYSLEQKTRENMLPT